jgi:hypothetical protein
VSEDSRAHEDDAMQVHDALDEQSDKPTAAELRARCTFTRVALKWPDEVAAALGVSRTWLYASGLPEEIRLWRSGKYRLVTVRELERAIAQLSARWNE